MAHVIERLAEIAPRYDALFVDLWGCVHDGLRPFPAAIEALSGYRAGGGIVILVTNSPRSREGVEAQLQTIGLPRSTWDAIATSGDSARSALFQGVVGTRVWFMGQPHDQAFFQPPRILQNPLEISQVPLEQAEGIVCCGPSDPYADPSTWQDELEMAQRRGLKLLCANPDIVVDRGERREWCAGALAQLYTQLGGESLYFGKPHAPIYALARRRLAALHPSIPDQRILAIGDGILTDIAGAAGQKLSSLFITGGLAALETKTERDPDLQALDRYLADQTFQPTYAIGHLR